MTTDIIEGEAVELEPEPVRSLVPAQPGQVIVTDTTPVDMLERATAIATALSAMVEAQKLYTTIGGKKYPHVEAWMTIGRMDNVVTRESQPPVRQDDGSWEAFVDLIRLSDGMVVGSASALCGAAGDFAGKNDWTKRADHHKRSMAVTRATSRAFRLQYSWIMALAGYQPTPADEMPGVPDEPHETTTHDGGLIGTAEVGKGPADFELRQGPDGPVLAFKLVNGRKGWKVIAKGPLAEALATLRPSIEGQRVTVWGTMADESFDKTEKGKTTTITYQVVHAERVQTPDGIIPAPGVAVEAPTAPMFDQAESDAIDREAAAS